MLPAVGDVLQLALYRVSHFVCYLYGRITSLEQQTENRWMNSSMNVALVGGV
jgi:hypothetical protein